MDLRAQFTDAMKTAMKAGDSARTGAIRLIIAKLKEADIAARPKGVDKIPDAEILSLLRGMIKSRQESVTLYRQGNREELAQAEEAEIAVIRGFLPPELDEAALADAVAAAVAEAGATSIKDMGKVMAALKAKHGAALDMAKAGAAVKARLSA